MKKTKMIVALAGSALLFLVVFCYFLLDPLINSFFPGQLYSKRRLISLYENLPGALDGCGNEKKKILVVGGSTAELAFAPQFLDGKKNCGLNAGVIGIDMFLDSFTYRLSEVLAGRKFDEVFFVITPQAMSREFHVNHPRFNRLRASTISYSMIFQSITAPAERSFFGSPEEAMQFLLAKVFFAGNFPTSAFGLVGTAKHQLSSASNSLASRLWVNPIMQADGRWNAALGGYPSWETVAPDVYTSILREARTEPGITELFTEVESMNKMSQLQIDERAFWHFVFAVRNLRDNARRLTVLHAPMDPLHPPTAVARTAMQQLFARVEKETGVQVVKMSGEGFTADDYLDFVHFNSNGAKKFTERVERLVQ